MSSVVNAHDPSTNMATTISATYSKKLGLPNYSSHSFLVTVQAEISSLRRVEPEAARLYLLLQTSVDAQVQKVGFIPDATSYGMHVGDGRREHSAGDNGLSVGGDERPSFPWGCSEKQRGFILKTAQRLNVSETDLNHIAGRLFNLSAAQLNKRQASRLIDELFEMSEHFHNGRSASPAKNPLK